MDKQEFDVIVIGAGAAGLMGALEIAVSGLRVAILEAKDRVGGRVYSQAIDGLTIELGAEFIHGDLPLTKQLLQQAGANTYEVKGSIWQKKGSSLKEQEDFIEDYEELEKKCGQLQKDKPVAAFFKEDIADDKYKDLRSSLKNYVEGYYAADINRSSMAALCKEMATEDEEQYRIEEGYQTLINYLQEQCRLKGVAILLLHPVQRLYWKTGSVEAVTEKGSFTAAKALLTVPIGVLKNESIRFVPSLPKVKEAVDQLGFGHVIKIMLQFDEAFWRTAGFAGEKNLSTFGFLFSEEKIPTWWTHYPKENAVLTGWLAGPQAEALQKADKDEVVQHAVDSLAAIFKLDAVFVRQKLKGADFHNWSADVHVCGAYSFDVVGGETLIKKLQQPVEETLYFAGEGLHLGKEIGTVEGALQSGRETALRLINSFSI